MIKYSNSLVGLSEDRAILLNYIELDQLQKRSYPVQKIRTSPPPRTVLGTYQGEYLEQLGYNGLPSLDFKTTGQIIQHQNGPIIKLDNNDIQFLRIARPNEMRSLFPYFEVEEIGDSIVLKNNTFVNEKHYMDDSVQNLIYPFSGNPVKVNFRFDYRVGTGITNSAVYGSKDNAYFRIVKGQPNHDQITLIASDRNFWNDVTGECEYNVNDPNTDVWMQVYCLPDTGGKNYSADIFFNPFTKQITLK